MSSIRYFNNCTESNKNRMSLIVPTSDESVYIQMNICAMNLSRSDMVYNIALDMTTSEKQYTIDLFGINELYKTMYDRRDL